MEYEYEDFYNGHDCLICKKHCKNRRSLGNHLHKAHNVSIYDYVLKYKFKGEIPKCACNCGGEVKWHKSKYRFNEYINGHNDTGYDISSYEFTEKDIEKRIKSIKKTYKENKEEISKKISTKVKEAWEDEEKVKNNSIGKKKLWSDKNYHARMTKIRKKVWEEQGDELREKIFTPEFGKKIALANMKRDMKKKSQAEENFVNHLKSVGLDAKEDKWFNLDGKTKCYDAYLYEERLLIEFDGLYWHGLDREEKYTNTQIKGMANDLAKNKIAREQGWKLIRIREDIDYSHVKTVEDLIDCAYHYQDETGKIIKDGRIKIEDGTIIMSKEDLLRIYLDPSKGREYIEKKNYVDLFIILLREYVDEFGWFYPPQKEDLNKAVNNIISKEIVDIREGISSLGGLGTSYLKSIFQSYWNVDNGPIKSFYNDKKLRQVLDYRFGLNNSKMYDYTLDGEKVQYHEVFDINLRNIRRGFIVQRKAVSFFKPRAAYEIYSHFLKGIDNPRVWDPSSGFGARMLGFTSYCVKNKVNGTYIGNEPATQTFEDLHVLGTDIEDSYKNVDYQIFKSGSEYEIPIGKVDLVFTSPPYFKKECYFDEDGQCWKDYPNLELWKKHYLTPTFINAFKYLKNEGKMVINVSSDLKDDIISSAVQSGFVYDNEYALLIGRDHFAKRKGSKDPKSEPILVFKKI